MFQKVLVKQQTMLLPTAVKGIGKKLKELTSEELTSRMGLTDKGL